MIKWAMIIMLALLNNVLFHRVMELRRGQEELMSAVSRQKCMLMAVNTPTGITTICANLP